MMEQNGQSEKTEEESTDSEPISQPKGKIEPLRKQEQQNNKTPERTNSQVIPSQIQEPEARKTLKELVTLAWQRLIYETCEILEQLIKFAIQAFAGLVLFALFFFASLGVYFLCETWPEISILVMVKVVAWIISAFGGFCCIALVVRNTIVFVKFLIKGPPQNTPGPNVASERGDK